MSDNTSSIIDWEALSENFDNDRNAIALVVDAFLDSVQQGLDDVRLAVNSGDARSIALAAHSLRGAMSNFGATAAVAVAQELESIGYGDASGDVKALLPRLEAEVRALVAALHADSHRYRDD